MNAYEVLNLNQIEQYLAIPEQKTQTKLNKQAKKFIPKTN